MAINKLSVLEAGFPKMPHLWKTTFSRTFHGLLDGFGHDALHQIPEYTLLL